MANSEFEYVRKFEDWDALAPSNWIVVRIDGRGFSKMGLARYWEERGWHTEQQGVVYSNLAEMMALLAEDDAKAGKNPPDGRSRLASDLSATAVQNVVHSPTRVRDNLLVTVDSISLESTIDVFARFSKRQNFAKPNDRRAIDLMNAAAVEVVKQFTDIVIAYGQSDEYSFVLHEDCQLFERRAAKLATSISTAFSVEYCMQWDKHFAGQALERPFPTFDGRCVLYPKKRILRDYLSWRQADCHVNNLYNTTFWNMVKGNPATETPAMTPTEAELALKGTFSADKNEILFKKFNINYNAEDEIWKKGSVVYRKFEDKQTTGEAASGNQSPKPATDQEKKKPKSKTQMEKEKKRKQKARVVVEHVDIIKDKFWQENPWILD